MNKAVLIGIAILTVSTSAASAWPHHSSRNGYRTHHSSAYPANRAAQREAMSSSAYNSGYYGRGYAGYGPGYAGYYGPAGVAGAAVGTAGAVAAGAVNTAGAIATAPFRPVNPYGYYPANSYAMAPGGVSSQDHDMYVKNLRDSGYDPKNDFTKAGTLRTQ